MPYRSSFLLIVLCLGMSGLAGCDLLSQRPRHFLLLTVDSLRPDRLGRQMEGRPLTPAIDRLAAESLPVRRATAPAVLSLPSLASLMTGVTPVGHGVRFETGYRLPPGLPTLGERLAGAGYRTAGFVGTNRLGPITGLNRGLSAYVAPEPAEGGERGAVFEPAEIRLPARQLGEMAMNWLRQSLQDRTFVWIHFRDLHYPYQRVGPDGRAEPVGYDLALEALDREIGRILDSYRRLELLDDTVVILTAPHGESLGEHGEATHSNFLYRSALEVPLLIRAGSGTGVDEPPAPMAGPARLIDLVPTVIGMADLSRRQSPPGRSLLGNGETGDGEEFPAYAESFAPLFRFGWSPVRSVATREWKLIATGGRRELYRVAVDREESDDLAASEPQRLREMEALLERIDPHPDPLWTAGSPHPPALRAELLGRLHRASNHVLAGHPARGRLDLEDVLRLDPGNLYGARVIASLRKEEGDREGAERILRAAVKRHAGLAEARMALAEYLADDERPLDAAAEYLAALDLAPDRIPLLLQAADQESKGGRLEEAVYWMERAVEQEEDSAFLHSLAADFYREFLDFEKSLAHLERAARLRPGSADYRVRIGRNLQHLGRYEEALKAFRRAEELNPDLVLGSEIGATYLLLERDDEAIEEFLRLLSPADPPLIRRVRLADLLSSKGRPDLSLQILAQLEREFPEAPQIFYSRGEILLTEKKLDEAEAEFQRVLQLDPGNRSTLYNLARVSLRRNDEKAGLDYLRRAMEGDDGSLRAMLRRDPFFWQVRRGSPLQLYLAELLRGEAGP